jgi:hypothetical protein
MRLEDWETVYGGSVQIINKHIIAAFRPEQIRAATEEAKRQEQEPMVVAKGTVA